MSGPAAFGLIYLLGRVLDCSPHQKDGQCGLATGVGLMLGGIGLFGLTGSGLILFTALGIDPLWSFSIVGGTQIQRAEAALKAR